MAVVKLTRTRAMNELRGLCGRMVQVSIGGEPNADGDVAPEWGTVQILGRLNADGGDRRRFYLGIPGVETGAFTVPMSLRDGVWWGEFLMLHCDGITIGVRRYPAAELREAA